MIEPYRSTKIICLQFVPAPPAVVPMNCGSFATEDGSLYRFGMSGCVQARSNSP